MTLLNISIATGLVRLSDIPLYLHFRINASPEFPERPTIVAAYDSIPNFLFVVSNSLIFFEES